jgi:hypothetical protein
LFAIVFSFFAVGVAASDEENGTVNDIDHRLSEMMIPDHIANPKDDKMLLAFASENSTAAETMIGQRIDPMRPMSKIIEAVQEETSFLAWRSR